MGRAFRFVRRIAHLEIVLAERGRDGAAVATVVGEEGSGAKKAAPAKRAGVKAKAKAPTKKKAVAKKATAKK
jgi:large subunit ribosomal protein L22